MDEKRIVDYFVVAGLPDNPEPVEEFSDENVLKPDYKQDPVTDIAIIIRSLGETAPKGYKILEFTPSGFPADLNHGSIRAPEIYLCYKRGREKPPLTDIGVLYEGKERVMSGCEVIHSTIDGRSANVNNTNSSKTFITYRRADETAASDTLAVTDITVILANKGEVPPHAFCKIDKTLNKGMVGSDVYICYKKSMAKKDTIAYKPAILGRYPLEDYPNLPLLDSVPMFCLPLGASLECWPSKAQHPLPVFSTFVLTGASFEKVYGAAVMFYEEYDQDSLTDTQRQLLGLIDENPSDYKVVQKKSVHHNKCICLLSRWPFFDTFRKFLLYIYRIAICGPHPVPIERHISHFIHEVPFPSSQRPRILVQLNHDTISISQPEETPLPQSGASFMLLLKNLGAENCLNLLLAAMIESKILIHSLRPAVLTAVAEALANMIFPFHWQCPYIPLCPLNLSDVLSAPCPFIVGVDSRYFDLYDPPADVTCVDLDTNTITSPDIDKKWTYKALPKKAVKVLKATLDRLSDKLLDEPSFPTPMGFGEDITPIDHDFKRRRKLLEMETTIQEAFLRFMASIMKGYQNYLLPITRAPTASTTDVSSLFDVTGFLKSRDKAYHKFFVQLLKTQLFSRFIEERSFVSDNDASLAFFDECVDKVEETRDEPKLIELDDTSKSERTVFITPPEPVGLPNGATYSYNGFPKLNKDLFLPPNKPVLMTPHKQALCPNSPMTRRTKQEIKSAQKIAQRHVNSPQLWAKCLLSHCYSLWFIHLPAYVKSVHSKTKALRTAYEVLVKMQAAKLQPPDEVCYRVLMQLCGLYQQPVLAVKVLFEMKRAGVQPNAITYGFYNKAVLESKWPSSESKGYLTWNKLRCVLLAMAQFRMNLHIKKRRLSVYSTSESDFDRISRTSTDSFVDEIQVDPKHEVHKPKDTEFVNDLVVAVESPNMEEKTSMGGMSDRGYSSMTLDDAKRASIIIGSQDSLDSLSKQNSNKVEKREHPRPISRISLRKKRSKSDGIANEKGSHARQELKFDAIDVQSQDNLRRRSGIVKSARSSFGSGSTLRGSTCSSAGLLMTSQTKIDESVFGDLGLSRSLKSTETESEKLRRRHKSTSDIGLKRAVTLQEYDIKLRHQSSDMDHLQLADALAVKVTKEMAQDKNNEGSEKSRFSGSYIKPGHSTILEANETANKTNVPRTSNKDGIDSLTRPLMGLDLKEKSEPSSGTISTIPHLLNMSPKRMDPVRALAKKPEDIFSDIEDLKTPVARTSSLGSNTSSPAHSVRTPVTENDPLGLFSPPVSSDKQQASLSGMPDLLGLNDSKDSGISTATSRSANRSNLLIDIEPFRSPSKDRLSSTDSALSTPKNLGAGDGDTRTYTLIKTSSSMSSNDTSSPGSPAGAWAPLSQSQSTPSERGDAQGMGEEDTLHTSSTSPACLENLEKTPDSKPHPVTPSSKRGKMLARGESFRNALSSTAKSTASFFSSRFSSKFAEIKQSMSPASNSSLDKIDSDSSGNLPKVTQEIDTSFDEDDGKDGRSLKKAGSEELLDSNKENLRNQGDTRSLDDTLDGTTKTKQTTSGKGYAGYVTGMWESLMSLQGMLQLQGLAESLQSLSSLESLKGATMGYSNGSTPTTPNGKGPEGAGDQYVPFQDMDKDNISIASSTLGAQKISGSIQSIPQAFYSCGMEVEICSLSRCNSCSSLLYDEEIMAGWSADDSNLNTSCQFCAAKLVPFLQILIKDYRQGTKPIVTRASESMASINSIPNAQGTLGSHAFRSMTSLKSADDVLLPTNKSGTSDLEANETNETAENDISKSDSGEKLIEFSPAKQKETKLVDFSPTDEIKQIVNGVTESESNTDENVTGKESENVQENKAEESKESVDGNVGAKTKLSPIVSHQPESPTRRRAISESQAQSVLKKEHDAVSQNSQEDDSKQVSSKKGVHLEPFTVPFLSPLVLRKEVENVFEHEGDMCVGSAKFADEHPIIYWNLVWYFKRLDVASHLPGFILTAAITNKEGPPPKAWSSADSRHVVIKPVWDNLSMHGELGTPLYALWANVVHQSTTLDALITESQECPKSVMQAIVSSIMMNDVVNPIKLLLNERRKQKTQGKARFRSMYQEIIFLSLVALGRDNIDCDAFDREYRLAFSQLGHRELARLRVYDRPPNNAITWCRRIFSDLEL